jgi:urease accessory protein
MNASVLIQVATHNDSSFLKQAYAEPPFRVANVTETRNPEQLELMLMSSSPGVLDEDCYNINIGLDENTALHLTTQSYQRLFSMKKGATQNMVVGMAKGSSLVYLPHPVVPHESAVFRASNKIYVSESCNLIWAEILTCGRKLNGERFLFSFYHTVTEIFLNNKLVVKENLRMAPGRIETGVIGQLEGFTHQASLICLSPSCLINEKKEEILVYLATQKDILSGVTTAPVNGLIIRLLGNRAEQLFDCVKKIAGLINFTAKVACPKPLELGAEVKLNTVNE